MRSPRSGRDYPHPLRTSGSFSCPSAVDQSDYPGRRILKLMFKALIASILVSVKSNEVLSRLDSSLLAVFVLGMTAMPFCVAQRRTTWPGSVPVFGSCHTLQ
jgi:hypothetical protein